MAYEKRPRTPLTHAIMALGLGTKEFVQKKLGVKYEGFRYRVRHGSLRLEEYHKLMQLTGRSFEELFPSPYATSQRIPLNLASKGTIINEHDRDQESQYKSQAIRPTTTTPRLTPQEQREEPRSVTPPLPAPSIYDDGLPPID